MSPDDLVRENWSPEVQEYMDKKLLSTTVTKTFDFDEMVKSIPELEEVKRLETQAFLELLSDESRVGELVDMFNEVEGWTVNEKRLKKALKQLRKDGAADIPIVIEDKGTFDMRTLPSDADVILPAYVMNVQDSPRVHIRMLLTGQDLINYRETRDWDEDWVDYMIENHTGMSESDFNLWLPLTEMARPLLPLSIRESTASCSIRFSLRMIISGAPISIRWRNRLLRLMTRRYRSLRSLVANLPPSN